MAIAKIVIQILMAIHFLIRSLPAEDYLTGKPTSDDQGKESAMNFTRQAHNEATQKGKEEAAAIDDLFGKFD